jgi:EAL and modified HD-GYP domain-containing signal transduction protein
VYERFIARQPILDGNLKIFGYELLFRARDDNRAGTDPRATAQLIVSSTMLFDWASLVDGACAHINFGAEEILSGAALLLPSAQTVIEIPCDLEFGEELIEGIKNLRTAGYRVALDGYAQQPHTEKVLRYANFVKVDFLAAREPDQATVKNVLTSSDAKLIAKKVESWRGFEQAKAMGYSCFQGHFFLEPQLMKRRELAGTAAHCVELLRLVHQRPLDFLNSPLMARPVEVRSVHSAIALLGEDEFRRWASLVAMILPAAEKPNELIRTGLTRAFFCEALARVKSKGATAFEFFVVGLFSVMNAILDRPLADIMAEMAVSPRVREALTGKKNEMRYALDAAMAFESAKWNEFTEAMEGLQMEEAQAPECLKEADQIVKGLQI